MNAIILSRVILQQYERNLLGYLKNGWLLKNGKSIRLTLARETATGNSFTYLEIPKSDACLNHKIRKPVINSSTYLIVERLLRDVARVEKNNGRNIPIKRVLEKRTPNTLGI